MRENAKSRILIVEDEGVVAKDIQGRLERLGYAVVGIAYSGDKAVEAAGRLSPDLVLMDIKLRGDMDGIEAARKIRDSFNIPVVYLTAYTDDMTLKFAKTAEPYGYIVKPFGDRELHSTINMALYKHKAEKALRESENKYRAVIENATEGIVVAQDRKLQFVNPQFIVIMGYSEKELTSRPFIEFVHPDHREQLRGIHIKRLKGEEVPSVYEFRVVDKQGNTKWLENKGILIEWGGKPATLNFLRDITERKKAEEALRQSERELRVRNQINNIFLTTPDEKMYAEVLKLVLEVMQSEFGTFGYFEENGAFVVPAMTRNIFWEKCNVPEKKNIFERGTFGGIWSRAIKEEKTLFSNEGPFNTPKGHIPIKNTMVTPVIFHDEVISAIHIANKANGYDENDQTTLETFARHIAPVLYARLQADKQDKDRKRAEEALRESEQKYRALVEQSLQGIIIFHDFQIVFANPTAAKIAGLTLEEALALSPEDIKAFIPVEERATVLQRFEDRLAGKPVQHSYELRLMRQNGDEFWLDVFISQIEYLGKSAIQIVFIDITERKKAEEAYRSLVDHSLQGLAILQDGRVVFANQAMAEITGYTVDEMLSLPTEQVQAFVHPEDRALVWSQHRDRLDGKPLPDQYEFRGIRKDGSTCWLELHASLVEYQGRPAIQTAYVDITERERAEEALRESEERFRGIYENSLVGLYRTTPDGRILMANPALVQMLGYSSFEELAQRNLEVDGYFQEYPRSVFKQRIEAEGQVIGLESAWIRRDGTTLFVRESVRAIRDNEGNTLYYEGTVEDITERKQAEEKLIRLNRILETIMDINQDMFLIKDRRELLERICERIVRYAYKLVWIGFCDERTKRVVPAAQAGFEDGYLESVKITYDDTEYGKGPTGRAIKTKRPNIMRFIATDPRYEPWRKEALKRDYHSSAAIPIFRGDKAVGSLNVYADKEDAFVNEEIKLLQELAHDISTGLKGIDEENKRKKAEEELFDYQAKLKSLASQLSLIEERERHRLATDLHDQIGQALAISKMKLDSLRESVSSGVSTDVIEEISDCLGQVIQDTRTLTFDLSSPILYELGFEAAVAEWLDEQIQEKHGIKTDFEDDGQTKPLDDDIRVLLFRNVRELLVNVLKHANVKNVKVSIRKVDDRICVSVEDDGVGFDVTEVESMVTKKAKFGLFSIRELLESVGGHFEIKSKVGQGSKITMTAPLKYEKTTNGAQV